MKDRISEEIYFKCSTRESVTILFISCFYLIALCVKSTAFAETIEINDYEEFKNWWKINDGIFKTDNPPVEIPNSDSGVWFIAEETESKTFSVTFEITEKTCYSTETSVLISYFSFNSVVTLFPYENNGDPYYHFQISNSTAWVSTGMLKISADNDDQIITITGEVLPSGYFAFDRTWIIVDGATTGCTTSSSESTTPITEEPTTESTETTETAEEDITITVTTEEMSTQTTMRTTEMPTTESPSTSTTPVPDPEETLEPEPTEGSTTDYTTNSSPWTDLTTDTSDSDTPPTDITTSDTLPTDITTSDTPPTDNTTSDTPPTDITTSDTPPTDITTSDTPPIDITTSPTSTIEVTTSQNPGSPQPTTFYPITTTIQSSTIITTPNQPSTTTNRPGTPTSEVPSETAIVSTTPFPETTPTIGNPNNGLSTQDLVLFIILPSVIVASILIGGFSFAYFTRCCIPSGGIGKSSTAPTTYATRNHVVEGMTPSSNFVQEIPRVQTDIMMHNHNYSTIPLSNIMSPSYQYR